MRKPSSKELLHIRGLSLVFLSFESCLFGVCGQRCGQQHTVSPQRRRYHKVLLTLHGPLVLMVRSLGLVEALLLLLPQYMLSTIHVATVGFEVSDV